MGRKHPTWVFEDIADRDGAVGVLDGDECIVKSDGSQYYYSSGWKSVHSQPAPGYLDFTGAVYANHMDTKTGGTTWTAETGPDLVDTYGAASEVRITANRNFCFLAAGGLQATLDATLQIAGDVTVLLALRRMDTSTAVATYLAMATAGETEAENILYSITQQSTRLEARHEYGAGTDEFYTWNTADAPDIRYFIDNWCVVWYRRSGTDQWLGVDSFYSPADPITNPPTGGGSGVLQLGTLVGSQLVASMGFAGVGIWNSALSFGDIAYQAGRIRGGAPKL